MEVKTIKTQREGKKIKMTVHLLISGFVQGVGYRQFVKKRAADLGILGWVKNLPDRRVEVLAAGEKKDLEKLIDACKKGPFLAKIDNINKDWFNKDHHFKDFSILID